jgi:ABC-type transport system involved in multi-copper enzyme maturation permease subunit
MIEDLKRQIVVELFKILRARLGRIALFTAFIGVAAPIILIGILGDRRISTFPGVVPDLLLPSLTLLIGIISVLLALSSWGDEYEHGTVRAVLSRCPERWQFLLGKTAALAIALAAIIVLAVAAEVAVAAASHLIQIGAAGLTGHLNDLMGILLPVMGAWWLAGMVYTAAVTLVVIGSQSPALGMAAGLALFLGDFLLSALGPGGSGAQFGSYSVVNNSYGLIASALGEVYTSGASVFPLVEALALPEPAEALGRLALYAAATLGVAYVLFRQRDLSA